MHHSCIYGRILLWLITKLSRKRERIKRPKLARRPDPKKQVKEGVRADDMSIAWRFRLCDHDGKWAWSKLFRPADCKRVIKRLGEFEIMNWNEIIRTGSHPIDTANLTKDARNRLQEIHRDDIDQFFSFRISGIERVWCIKQQNMMYVLWWDPKHEICPSPLRHT